MTKVWILVGVVVIGAVVYFAMMGKQTISPVSVLAPTQTNTETTTPAAGVDQPVMLAEQNMSGESGTAVLIEKDGKVVVTLNMTGAPSEVPQPAHIHTGACPDVGAVVYPLTNVINGTSETTLDVTLGQLAAQQPLGINVHKSVPETKVYVSCGDLSIPTDPSTSSPTSPSTSSPNSQSAPAGQTNTGY